MGDKCIFCEIVKGKIPSFKIYEDDSVLSFLDINPVNPGHTLVIPKKHYPYMYDCDNNDLKNIFEVSKKLMKDIKEKLKCDFVALSVVGLDVSHFHVHLVPRYKDDGLANFWTTKKYSKGEAEIILNKIRSKK